MHVKRSLFLGLENSILSLQVYSGSIWHVTFHKVTNEWAKVVGLFQLGFTNMDDIQEVTTHKF